MLFLVRTTCWCSTFTYTYQQNKNVDAGEDVLVDFMTDGAVNHILFRHGDHHHTPLTLHHIQHAHSHISDCRHVFNDVNTNNIFLLVAALNTGWILVLSDWRSCETEEFNFKNLNNMLNIRLFTSLWCLFQCILISLHKVQFSHTFICITLH